MADITIWRDKIIASIGRWRGEDQERAVAVGEQRSEIKEFLETTGIHKKALAWIRSLDKMEPERRDDVLRSFDALRRDVMEPYWDGQKTPDMFDPPAPVVPEGHESALPRPTYNADFDPDEDDEPAGGDSGSFDEGEEANDAA